MKKLILAAVAAVMVTGSFGLIAAQPAAAQGVIVQVHDNHRHHYRHHRHVRRHIYVRPGYYERRYYRGYHRRVCRYGFTVQDGVCKPYRGY